MSNTNQIHFYMTEEDIALVLTAVEKEMNIKYVEAGQFESESVKEFPCFGDIRKLKIPVKEDAVKNKNYLVVPVIPNKPIITRKISRTDGSVRYAIDQLMNPDSLVINFGGTHQDGLIISGRVAIVSGDSNTKDLFDIFKEAIIKYSKKVKAYYVGNEAYKRLKEGWRLTMNLASPKNYDLVEGARDASV